MNYCFMIRRAVPEDAQAIHEILQRSFTYYKQATGLDISIDALSETPEDILHSILDKDVFIALIDNQAVGTIRVQVNTDGSAYISRFGVIPNYHNIGIGKSLMNLVDKLLSAQGVHTVSLHTASKARDLIRFYYGRGFYIHSTTHDRGYIRALLVKEYAN